MNFFRKQKPNGLQSMVGEDVFKFASGNGASIIAYKEDFETKYGRIPEFLDDRNIGYINVLRKKYGETSYCGFLEKYHIDGELPKEFQTTNVGRSVKDVDKLIDIIHDETNINKGELKNYFYACLYGLFSGEIKEDYAQKAINIMYNKLGKNVCFSETCSILEKIDVDIPYWTIDGLFFCQVKNPLDIVKVKKHILRNYETLRTVENLFGAKYLYVFVTYDKKISFIDNRFCFTLQDVLNID